MLVKYFRRHRLILYTIITWSSYKQHNTAKYLIGVTPNGAISFVSQVFVGSISDSQLTHCSGLLSKLEGKHSIFVMADRGFAICDQLQPLGIKYHRKQLKAEEVQQGRSIASIRIHVECAIGRMKNFTILKDVFSSTWLVLPIKLCQCVHG